MANDTIQDVLVTQFSAKVHAEAQQVKARTRSLVRIVPMNAERMAYDGIGTVEAQEIVSRNQPVQFSSILHKRRMITSRRFAVTLPIDKTDVERALLDQKSEYPRACVMGMERKFDRVVVEAAFASVKTGQDFSTTVTASTDGVVTVDATAGLTFDKILEVKQRLLNNEVGTDVPAKVTCLFTGDEHTSLMGETKLTSGDYSRQFVVDKGEIVSAMGLNLLFFGATVKNPILQLNTSSKRRCMALTDSAICVGMQRNVNVVVQPRNDYYDTDQVQVSGVWGAVRTEGVQVIEITTTPRA